MKQVNLLEILPELRDGWESHADDGFYRTADNGEFDLYIVPYSDNTVGDEFRAEIGLHSKSPFKNAERLKRKFSWYMDEYNMHRPIVCEERADGFEFYLEAAKWTGTND